MNTENPTDQSSTGREQPCPRAKPDALQWLERGIDGQLLLGIPTEADVEEAVESERWIVGRGTDLLEVA